MSLTLSTRLSKVKKALFVFLKVLPFSYPFVVYYFINSSFICYITVGLVGTILVGAILVSKAGVFSDKVILCQSLGIGIAVLLCSLIKPNILHLIYPVLMSFGTMLGFLYTLIKPPSMIERIARLNNADLGVDGVIYTRNLTKIWVVFCGINTLISLATVIAGNVKIWFLYNGIISYVLMGTLVIADLGYRYFSKKKNMVLICALLLN